MKPVRTPDSNILYTLPGGNEDNYLHAQLCSDGVKTNWRPTKRELKLIAGGGVVALVVYGLQPNHPTVRLEVEPPFCRRCKNETSWDDDEGRFVCPNGPHETP